VPQVLPQVPQLNGSELRSTHLPPQTAGVSPVVQVVHPPPAPLTQIAFSGQHCPLHFTPLGQTGLAAQAIPGMDAKVPPTKAAPNIRSALRLETVPVANAVASSSKECSLASLLIALSPFPKGGAPQPCRVTLQSKYEELQELANFREHGFAPVQSDQDR
jgi:hypothetical protein